LLHKKHVASACTGLHAQRVCSATNSLTAICVYSHFLAIIPTGLGICRSVQMSYRGATSAFIALPCVLGNREQFQEFALSLFYVSRLIVDDVWVALLGVIVYKQDFNVINKSQWGHNV
jgi:hypothetical protein